MTIRSGWSIFDSPMLFVQGKGGVGKTTLAHAIAHLDSQHYRTLLVSIEDPTRPPYDLIKINPSLSHLNLDAMSAFEEYAGKKIGAPRLVHLFLQNRVMRYLAQAAPGVRELVLLGKLWYETRNYERIVVDMPATGHGLTLFQSLINWSQLLQGSPLASDSKKMIDTFSDPSQTSHLIVSLPEEMPLIESLELRQGLLNIFPQSNIVLLVNKKLTALQDPQNWGSHQRPFAENLEEHATRKFLLEKENMKLWDNHESVEVPYFSDQTSKVVEQVTHYLVNKQKSVRGLG